MAKPSIFSKEYEKRMRKRRRKILIVFLIVLTVVLLTTVKLSYRTMDKTNVKQKIQAWIDSDTVPKNEKQDIIEEKSKVLEEPEQELPKTPEKKYLDINLLSGTIAKGIYIEENGEKKFTDLEGIDSSVEFDISPTGKQILILDTDKSITVYNVDGNAKIVSKNDYTSQKGDVFTKEATLLNKPEYLWNSTPKFINDESIVFISNRPYFGTSALKQYLWVTNIVNNTDVINWNLVANKIEIEKREEKGIKIMVDGNIYYVAQDGNIIQ
ncbi:hypothetical protein [Clostridium uliginosum]|uniref:Uncharacterized protein n=1 Tax=Clostridium uliginosum TaxID=119641 RepID=A0A1I1M6X1_9CLOT|nr:hypothetical protein [Clostridium uliginosum]SFC77410.1 hypothetical protein SAMN05421842_10962 [Clostridium uliginosum]